jgi:iron complex transport system permease protein
LAPNPGALADLVNWTLGSVEGRSLEHVALAGALLALGACFIFSAARGLQALTLGEEAAAAIGANLSRTRTLIVLGAAACTGGATAVAGIIGFRRYRRAAPWCARSAATIPRACWLAERA